LSDDLPGSSIMLVHQLLTSRLLVLASALVCSFSRLRFPRLSATSPATGSPDVSPAGAVDLPVHFVVSSVSLMSHTGHTGTGMGSCVSSLTASPVLGSPFCTAVGFPVRSELLLVYSFTLKWVCLLALRSPPHYVGSPLSSPAGSPVG
jgi:hypothetical protein